MKVLTWNLKGNSIAKELADCLATYEVDIAILTEYSGIDFNQLLCFLGGFYSVHYGSNNKSKVVLISKSDYRVESFQNQERYGIYRVNTLLDEYIIVGVHLQDRGNSDADDRIDYIKEIKTDIEQFELLNDCYNTIVIGDFNANPYDRELLSVHGFNAVLFKSVIKEKEVRIYNHSPKKRFYNPILLKLSEKDNMYGSFYYSSGSATPVWHCLDQVIVRKALMEKIVDIKYLKEINGLKLVGRVKPLAAISDHLPLLVQFKEV